MASVEAGSENAVAAQRREAGQNARAVAEHDDRHAVTLEALLAALRSDRLDDRAARSTAIEIAVAALVDLRKDADAHRGALLEPVVGAFSRLRADLKPLARFSDLDVQFVEPPTTGRALPGEVAHEARAIVRNAVLARVEAGDTRRMRIQWDCDGLNLLIGVRDDGTGETTAHDDALRPIAERVSALNGTLEVTSTPGWGSELAMTLPLDPPAAPDPLTDQVSLSPRERDVLRLVVEGRRNAAIATELGISANTVKFHVSNLLHKVGAASRAELVALARG